MFPIPFNFPFKKSDGSLSTIGAEISAGGGGGGYTLPTASGSTKGGVKIGNGLTMTGEVLSNDNPTPYSLPTAAADTLGGVKVGTNLSIDENGVLSASGGGGDPYVLPAATASTLGGIKVGSGLSVTQDGTLSASGGGGGGTLYEHNIVIYTTSASNRVYIGFKQIDKTSTAYNTVQSFYDVYGDIYKSTSTLLPVSMCPTDFANHLSSHLVGIYFTTSGSSALLNTYGGGTSTGDYVTSYSINDVVRTI